MNQEKIGKFLAELRKEKSMTQSILASKLGVTDRAISKWENGRGMPDLSLIRELCKCLDITINDLLSGEIVDKKEYQNKLEENIFKTIDYSEKKIKSNRKRIMIILGIICFLMTFFIAIFTIDINRMQNNQPVIFGTWGFDYIPPVDLSSEKIEIAIIDDIISEREKESKTTNNEKWFVSLNTYLIEEKESKKTYYVYAWVLEESYYIHNNEIIEDSGSSIPYMFTIQRVNNEYTVKNTKIPRDGSFYANDMKQIFPYSVRKQMDKVYDDGTIEKLKMEINNQMKLYFHK